jgi:hypothetical protein
MIASQPYVQSVYFVLGDIDFVVIAKFPSRGRFMKFLESTINSPEIERTSTLVVVKVIKEDLRYIYIIPTLLPPLVPRWLLIIAGIHLFWIVLLLDPQVLILWHRGASTPPPTGFWIPLWSHEWLLSPAAPGSHLYLKLRRLSGHCPHIEADQGYYLSMPLLAFLATDPYPPHTLSRHCVSIRS